MNVEALTASQVTGAWANHGEGPIWDQAVGVLRWVDMFRGDVLSWRPGNRFASRLHVGQLAAAVRCRRRGGLVVAIERGFALIAPGDVGVVPLPQLWADESVRMNDGACDPHGRFYCGSMDHDAAAGRGGMHRLDPDGRAHLVLDGLTISNGLTFSPDGRLAYLIDTPTRCVTRYDVDDASGCFVNPVPVVQIPADQGDPDGMAVDADGGFWIAMWDGYAVRHYGPGGDLRAVVQLPVSRPTACTFGGPDGCHLYITSSNNGIDSADEPGAGAVFVVRTNVRGPAGEFFDG